MLAPHRYNLDMLTWSDLGAVANEICRVSGQLLEEARRLEREDRPVREFRRTEALPRVLVLSDRLGVSFSDRLHVERRTSPRGQERDSPSSAPVDVDYHAIAGVTQRSNESGPVVAFHFATKWPTLDPRIAAPEARVLAQRELRRLDTALRRLWTARPRWTGQNRPVVDTSKPASGRVPQAQVLYRGGLGERKRARRIRRAVETPAGRAHDELRSPCKRVRQLRGPHVRTCA